MAASSSSKNQNQHSTSSRPPKPAIPTSTNNVIDAPKPTTNSPIILSTEDIFLSRSSHVTRQELLRRRSHNLKQLIRCYRDHYWALMEDLKIQYREYYWKFGVSPFKEEQARRDNGVGESMAIEGSGENINISGIGRSDLDVKSNRCAFVGCKLKAMVLTNFCHLHILSDSKQKLYKPCNYVIKSAQAGPITCGKPILRSTVPSLCTVHFQKAQKHVIKALKKAGLSVSSSTKLAPKFHMIVAEYVCQIQAKRRALQRVNSSRVVIKEESAG